MNGYGFYRSLNLVGFVIGIALMGILLLGGVVYGEIREERLFYSHYGATWRSEFEQAHGPLGPARMRAAVAGVGALVVLALAVWVRRVARPDYHGPAPKRRKRHRSPQERAASYRRNAVLGIYSGVCGVLAGVMFVLFRWGIFQDHANEVALGFFVFLLGYCGVLAGCTYWLKAKQWPEAIVAIALMPLGIMFIPFVRLLLFTSPALLPASIILMTFALIVVVWALPDRGPRAKVDRRAWNAFLKSGGAEDAQPEMEKAER